MESRDIKLTFEGKTLELSEEIYEKANRYYIPLNAFISIIETVLSDKSIIENLDMNRELDQGHNLVYINESIYVSLFYLTKEINLKTTWDHQANQINLFLNKDGVLTKENISNGKKPALIRLEDITAGSAYSDAQNLEKLRTIGDMFFSKDIDFHISWIPRYVNPERNIDNELVHNYSINNCDFIYTLDYLISKGGIVGLHGYTHQYGDEESAIGSEFTDDRLTTESEIRERIEKAIDTANELSIPYAYFESPHYSATEFQMSIIEEYFDYIYEAYYRDYYDFLHLLNPYVSPRNNRTLYVPTPLGYVKSGKPKDINWMLFKTRFLPRCILASLFYHPTLEFQYIRVSREANGYPIYVYDEDSILNRIIRALLKKKCVITKIQEVVF